MAAALWVPIGVRVDKGGNLFITDLFNHRIRRVDAPTGIITTFAGNGQSVFSGNGGLAANAGMGPAVVVIEPSGNLFIADANSRRIRRIEISTNIITTLAGDGELRLCCRMVGIWPIPSRPLRTTFGSWKISNHG
jgi:DNA-binding beta-propeller fold protein YncE